MAQTPQPLTVEQAIAIAASYQQAGRLADAEAMCLNVLRVEARQADALHMLGLIAYQTGRTESALERINEAIRHRPSQPVFHLNLGAIYTRLNRLDEAMVCFQKALALKGDFAEAHNNLGNIFDARAELGQAAACYQRAVEARPDFVEGHYNLGRTLSGLGRTNEAIASYRKAVALRPAFAEAHNNLGLALHDKGELDAAVGCYRKALELKPDYAEAHNNLGRTLERQQKLDEAIASYEQALAIKPDFAEASFNLGNVFDAQGYLDKAIACYRRALALKPDYPGAHNNLGNALRASGRSGEAIPCFHRALELKPDFVDAYSNLGNALRDQGKLGEAIAWYRKALELKPDFDVAYDNLLFALQYDPGCSPSELYEEHRRFAKRFEVPLESQRRGFGNTREAGRRLKVGYVSADFRRHAVAYFVDPVLARHDKSQVEVFCYYNNAMSDDLTERIMTHADHWIRCIGMSDDELAERIRADGIDILVDLAGHTSGNRLLVFARKPAPVQVSWLGYPSTTGLSAIDYRITDRHAEPPGMTEQYSIEKLWRLDDMFCVYLPCAVKPERRDSPELAVRQTPALESGHITFGSVNNIAKITPAVVAVWARILHAVPGSGLLLEAPGFDGGGMRADFEARFAAQGIGRERLMLLERKPEQQYVLYHRIDIALDPFPCNGGTTTCDALWMGVPVVALAGTTFASRMGVTMVTNAGHPEWVARDEDEYLRLACELASDAPRLNTIRLGLRGEVERSPLRDEAGFTRSLEDAYRGMWRAWCEA